jgi:hypothetical protein
MRTLTEPFWLIDNIDVKSWYYRDAPAIGSIVRYVNEDFIDTVARVSTVGIWFESGHMMRRPYLFSRLLAWITAQLSANRPRYKRQWNTPGVTTPRLRPDMTILPV